MATGDDAAAGGMDLVAGSALANTLDTEDNKTRDYGANGPTYWKPGVKVPIGKGGTNAATAADALTNLGAVPAADVVVSTGGGALANKIPRFDANARLAVSNPISASHVATKQYVDTQVAAVDTSFDGGVVSGQIYLPNAFPANIGTWTVSYINGDGRISEGASSLRFKDDVRPVDPAALGDLFPQLHTFVMKADPNRTPRVGYIAEHMDAIDEQRQFVVYESMPIVDEDGQPTGRAEFILDDDGNPIPKAIDPISLLLAQVAQLHKRVLEIEGRSTNAPAT